MQPLPADRPSGGATPPATLGDDSGAGGPGSGGEGLRRELGLWTAIAIVIGTTIGSAIFIVPKTMILTLGSPGWVFVVWIVGGLLSLFGTLTYAELSSMYPESGAEYVYLA